MKTRIWILAAFVFGALAVGLLAFQRTRSAQARVVPGVIKPAVVRVAPLSERSYTMIEAFHGLIEAKSRVDMAFQIPGRLSQLGSEPGNEKGIHENDRVVKGQVLARLEPLRFEAAAQQASAKMEEAKASLSAAQAQISDAEARLADAKNEMNRVLQLKEKGVANQREIEKAETAVKIATAALDTGRAQLQAATASYESGRAHATMANVDLQDATLRAPMDALVAAAPVEIGQMITPAQRVITLVDISRVRLIAGVVERKLPLVRKGQKVNIEVQALSTQAATLADAKALSKPREGWITIVPPAADPVTGLFNVEIELDNTDGLLRPGMVGKASVSVMEKRAVALPLEAVTKIGDEYAAFFISDGYQVGLDLGAVGKASVNVPTPVARRVTFKPVAVDKDHLLVADVPEGLSRLVVEGQTRLTDGQPVQVLDTAVASQ